MKFVIQWKCNRWVNLTDSSGNTMYFDNFNSVTQFLFVSLHFPKTREIRICEYLGGRKYNEITRLTVYK